MYIADLTVKPMEWVKSMAGIERHGVGQFDLGLFTKVFCRRQQPTKKYPMRFFAVCTYGRGDAVLST